MRGSAGGQAVRRRAAAAVVLAAVLVAVAGCGGGDRVTYDSRDDLKEGEGGPAPTTSTTAPTDAAGRSYIATANLADQPVPLFDSAGGNPSAISIPNPNENGVVSVFRVRRQGVEANGEKWVELDLPIRPAGSVAWAKESDVTITFTDYLVVVELKEHKLRLEQNTVTVSEYPIGVGTTETPTPGGTFYIKEVLIPTNPGGAYGPFAFGLSGFSNAITDSDDFGDGVIGIHGTDHPELVGQDVSHGCIRMRNEDVTALQKLLPLGTPVRIDP